MGVRFPVGERRLCAESMYCNGRTGPVHDRAARVRDSMSLNGQKQSSRECPVSGRFHRSSITGAVRVGWRGLRRRPLPQTGISLYPSAVSSGSPSGRDSPLLGDVRIVLALRSQQDESSRRSRCTHVPNTSLPARRSLTSSGQPAAPPDDVERCGSLADH